MEVTKDRQTDQTFGRGMSGWDWDGDWELLLCAPALSGGISALWSSVEQNCHMRNKKMAEDYGDRGVQTSEKGFDGKRCLEEVLEFI